MFFADRFYLVFAQQELHISQGRSHWVTGPVNLKLSKKRMRT